MIKSFQRNSTVSKQNVNICVWKDEFRNIVDIFPSLSCIHIKEKSDAGKCKGNKEFFSIKLILVVANISSGDNKILNIEGKTVQ